MGLKVGDKLGKVSDGVVFDSDVTVLADAGSFPSQAEAIAEASRRAESSTRDAVVVEDGDRYEVYEIAQLKTPGTDGRSQALCRPAVPISVVARGSAGKVVLTGTGERSAEIDRLRTLFEKSGLTVSEANLLVGQKLSSADITRVQQRCQSDRCTMSSFGPRLLLATVLRQFAGRPSVTLGEVLDAFRPWQGAYTVRPDGYLQRLIDGAPLQHVGDLSIDAQGVRAGDFTVGGVYLVRGGLIFAADAGLRPTGPSLGERGDMQELPSAVLDGFGDAVFSSLEAFHELLTEPVRALADLQRLPSVVADLIRQSPAFWATFQSLPLNEQTRILSRLTSDMLLFYMGAGGVSRLAEVVGDAAPSFNLPILNVDGSLALAAFNTSTVTTTAVTGGGALVVVHDTASRLADDDDEWRGSRESYGGGRRPPPAGSLEHGEGTNRATSVRRKPGKDGLFRGAQSKQEGDQAFKRVCKELELDKDQERRLHDIISGKGWSEDQIRAAAETEFSAQRH